MTKSKISIIAIIILAISLCLSLLYCHKLKNDYSVNTIHNEYICDSLNTELSVMANKYDSIHSYSDSVYELQKAHYDSLNALYEMKLTTNKSKVTYIYKDSTIIKEVENSELAQTAKIEYVTQEVIKEVIKTIHDTVAVSKIDTVYKETKSEVTTTKIEDEKEVVENTEFFNIYLDGGIKGNLDLDIIPELSAGVIFNEKFYGEIGANYDHGKINPDIKLGIRFKVF